MKRFYVLFAILLSLNICIPHIMHAQEGDPIGDAEDPEAIVIRDTNLSAAIRSTLGLAEDATLTATDMLNLRSLGAKKAKISDLRGLEHATNLTTLDLYSNQLTDLSPLSGLERLISLDLGKNTITDIEALSGLTALTTLYLDRNLLTDFGPLWSLTDLSVLHLSRTGISDVGVLGNLTSLTQLYLTENEISDISALSGLTALGWLFLAENEISDVSPLVGMEALVSLRLLGNSVSNASVLYPLTQRNLIDVDIEIPRPFVSVCDRTPQVRDAIVAAVPDVEDCADVTAAHLSAIGTLRVDSEDENVRSLKFGDFDGLTALEYLYLEGGALTSLPDGIFDSLTELTTLDLSGNRFTTLSSSVFDELTALTRLDLQNNHWTFLPDGIFDNLTELTHLDLEGYARGTEFLTALPARLFANNTELITLDLDFHDLSALPDGIFENLTKLKSLYLRGNDLSALPDGIFENLTRLIKLDLYGNAVDPLLFPVSLEKVGENQFKAVAPAGAPFRMVLPVSVTNGSISGGATSLTISTGSLESEGLTVTRTDGSAEAVTVAIGSPLPPLPPYHFGYTLVKSADLPLEVIAASEGANNSEEVNNNGAPALEIRPTTTASHPNYPNPFNPETWIPYQLARGSDVLVHIYDGRGRVVRRLELGHQRAGYYTNRSRAAHWDGRNAFGEPVASGIYFYQLQADNVSFFRKMVILK